MDEKRLLIIGLDPGMTTGYAVFGIDGTLIKAGSSKQLELNRLISETVELGKAIIVGTDKSKVPGLVEEFAVKLGARIISPKHDLKVDEKRKMTKGFPFDDEHQSDAIASALMAYKSVKPLFDKIESFAQKNKKQNIKNRIKEIVIIRQISIKMAVGLIENKSGGSKIVEKVNVEKKSEDKGMLKLRSKINDYENQMIHLRNYSNSLKNRINKLEMGIKSRDDQRNKPDYREKRMFFLENALKSKDTDLARLRELLKRLNKIIASVNDYYILKKLDNIGVKELEFKNKILNIRKNDIIMVNEPNVFSHEAVEFLRDKVFIVVCKKRASKNVENSLPFVFIESKNLNIDEDKYFGFVDKRQFEVEKQKIDWIRKMVEDYRNEKMSLR